MTILRLMLGCGGQNEKTKEPLEWEEIIFQTEGSGIADLPCFLCRPSSSAGACKWNYFILLGTLFKINKSNV